MDDKMELTAEEKTLLQTHLAKYEKSAKKWRFVRFYLLGIILFLYITGFHGILPSIQNAIAGVDKKQVIEMLSSEEIPKDITEDNWIVGYVNKTVVRSEHIHKILAFELFLAIIGAIHLTAAIIGTVLLISRWNHGERDLAIAKAIRIQLLKLE